MAALVSAHAYEQGSKTVFRYLPNGEDEDRSLTYAELDRDARAIAADLQRESAPGERALILTNDSIDFIRAFIACQYAGLIAVPAYPPFPMKSQRKAATLRAIGRDSAATVVLSSGPLELRTTVGEVAPELAALTWVDLDAGPLDAGPRAAAEEFRPVQVRPEDISFLQYTSGSTALPKGVAISHQALMLNERLIAHSMGLGPDEIIVCWLPLFHDMGLIGNILQTLYLGAEAILIPPMAFVQRPVRWLDAISRYGGTMSGAPNFAYDLCVRRIPPAERSGLDLSSWRLAFNGAEPIRAVTLDRFVEAFGPSGFDARAVYPCYGLAESTVLATGSRRLAGSTTTAVDQDALQDGWFVPGGDHLLVGCGTPMLHRRVEIVDPVTRRLTEAGRVGEIWLAGPDIASGYWERPEESAETFAAHLADTGAGPFLRTGDLGVLHDGELYVTGRRKDVIIVGGRNHYPQDIEATVEAVDPLVRPSCCVAFSLDRDGSEQVIIVAEIQGAATEAELSGIGRSVRVAVSAQHDIQVDQVALVKPGSVPKTSSGKVQRAACRAAFERGELTPARAVVRRQHQGVR